MLKNYVKIGLRTLWRSKAYSLINVIGLAIGIAGATLLMTYVKDEMTFDKFHSKSDRIVRAITTEEDLEGPRSYGLSQPILVSTVLGQIPDIEQVTMLQKMIGHVDFVVDGVRYLEREYFIGDSTLFEVFDFEFILGNKNNALSEPNSIVLTKKQAYKFFGRTDVLGEIINLTYIGDFKVTGVLKDIPVNSHIQFDLLISPSFTSAMSGRWEWMKTNWGAFVGMSYFVLQPDTDLKSFTKKINKLADERMDAERASTFDYEFQRLHDVHFESSHIEFAFDASVGDRSYIVILSSIAIFLLLIAAVNYMNLATSKSVFRAKEIGMRKVVGARKDQLVFQFMTESILITLMALLISIGLLDITMPFFNQLTDKQFDFSLSGLLEYLPTLVIVTVSVGLISGVYPSFFMTRFRPVDALKGEGNVGNKSFSLRKGLVVFQFVMSMILIIATLIVSNQMDYIKERDLGFSESNLMVVDINDGNVYANFKSMGSELVKIPGVESVGVSSKIPGEWKSMDEVEVVFSKDDELAPDSATAFIMGFDQGMLETFDFQLLSGKYFSGNDQSDSLKVLLNEAAVEAYGLETPVGSSIELVDNGESMRVEIIGVLKNFNVQSLHSQIRPVIVAPWNNPHTSGVDYFTLKVSGDIPRIIQEVTDVHEQFDKITGIEYHFLENQLELSYKNDVESGSIFKVGAGLSIIISCLGLIGLASFTVQKRAKEISIRKVLGANPLNLFYLLYNPFAKQVLLALFIACPIGFLVMKDWLSDFAYRVNIQPVVFLIAGAIGALAALATVGYSLLKVANSSPINSLRQD